MGCAVGKDNFIKLNSNKNIVLEAEIWDTWGYEYKANSFAEFGNYIESKGVVYTLTFIPKSGGKGEYFLYMIVGNERKIIVSNNRKEHEEIAALITVILKPNKYKVVLESILDNFKKMPW